MVKISKHECDRTLLPKRSHPSLIQPTFDEERKKVFWESEGKLGASHIFIN